MKSRIGIYGAGISGLVAAINLKRTGFKVEVRDKQGYIGPSPGLAPIGASVEF